MAKSYVIEHLDPELGPWSSLEYQAIAKECHEAGAAFYLTSLPKELELPSEFSSLKSFNIKRQGVEEIYAEQKARVCLLDPAAKEELAVDDGDKFDIFLFGGILGDDPPRGKITSFKNQQ